jgi:malonyl-CoA O-methyltransferase
MTGSSTRSTKLDKAAVAERFSRAAETYDASAEAQRRMAERLASILPAAVDGAIVDLGCGTGLMTARLLERYPKARVHGIDLAPGMVERCRRRFAGESRARFTVADADLFTPDEPASLVVSNCAFQWLAEPEAALTRIRGYLAPGGRLAIGTLLEGSLAELAESHEAATGGAMPALDLWDDAEWRRAMTAAGLRTLPETRAETLAIDYAGALDLMRALRAIGAHFGTAAGRRPLLAGKMRRLDEEYRRRFADPATGRVRATYRALLLLAEGV